MFRRLVTNLLNAVSLSAAGMRGMSHAVNPMGCDRTRVGVYQSVHLELRNFSHE
jgi:hypothetical protein